MKRDPDCIFCTIVAGESPSHTVWEDEKHLAFLSIFPNTEGVTVVIPKEHHDSYIADLPDEISDALLSAAKKVAKKIDAAYDDVDRCGFVFEGFGVNHIHVKLFPLHGTTSENWQKRASNVDKYFEYYEGHLSTHDYNRADDDVLAKVAKKIRDAKA
ncbi:MAG: diadenosine tetraphosphate hydrolase [Parcubacteria group bacterium RIFCSPHIGHO2_01_FULL_56_18]|nr:MAG: diadenosine tetraphosphate hydrolase [Parcubacteria group bacterium RIFCSPHIGHO2_01_FULL_56_18]